MNSEKCLNDKTLGYNPAEDTPRVAILTEIFPV